MFPAEEFIQATYDARMTIRDRQTGAEVTGETEFEVVPPFGIGEVSVVDIATPSSTPINDPFEYTLTLENTSGRDGSLVTSVSYRRDGETAFTGHAGELIVNISEDDQRSVEMRRAHVDQPGEYEFRLDAVEETFRMSVE